jgi:hypothetical protein
VRQEWSLEDVVACWTLVDGDWDLVANKSGPTRLGFCLMLKFFEIEGRFPEFIEEFPQPAVEYVAGRRQPIMMPSGPRRRTLPSHRPHRRDLLARAGHQVGRAPNRSPTGIM